MEHEVRALADGRVAALQFAVGDLVNENDLLLIMEQTIESGRGQSSNLAPDMRKNIPSAASAAVSAVLASQIPASVPRPDLQRVIDRHATPRPMA